MKKLDTLLAIIEEQEIEPSLKERLKNLVEAAHMIGRSEENLCIAKFVMEDFEKMEVTL